MIGHPRAGSYGHALAARYAAGARAAGCDVTLIDLAALAFDPDVHAPSPTQQPLERDLEAARATLHAAQHWVFVWPTWWGVGPARLWGFLDRVLLPGEAFFERDDHSCGGLLHGRTAHLMATMDMPPLVYRLVFKAPGVRALRDATLGLCGVATTHVEHLGPITHATDAQRAAWLDRAEALGASLARGARAIDRWAPLQAWLRAMRLQFHPMAWMAYSLGALAACAAALRGPAASPFDAVAWALGLAMLFAAEAATVFGNDLADEPSDARNRHFGPFTGGSRVVVDGLLTRTQLGRGRALASAIALMLAAALLQRVPAVQLGIGIAAMLGLAWSYTGRPLRLAWRGWGEVDVAVTHAFGVAMIGWLAQRGPALEPLPWLLVAPLAFAVLPAILLAGLPDRDADAEAGKRTLVVRLGARGAVRLALGSLLVALVLAVAIAASGAVGHAFDWTLPVVLPLGGWLGLRLARLQRQPQMPYAVNATLVIALNLLTLFAVLPLLRVWVG